jgi:hypothetical protein
MEEGALERTGVAVGIATGAAMERVGEIGVDGVAPAVAALRVKSEIRIGVLGESYHGHSSSSSMIAGSGLAGAGDDSAVCIL